MASHSRCTPPVVPLELDSLEPPPDADVLLIASSVVDELDPVVEPDPPDSVPASKVTPSADVLHAPSSGSAATSRCHRTASV